MPRSSSARRYAGTPRAAPYGDHSTPLPAWRLWQPVLNECWPAGKAWRIPRAAAPIRVRVRIVWRDDGETWLDAMAIRWTSTSVQVELDDYRLGPSATWVAPTDVRRAAMPAPAGASPP